jgi:hypothetical protein
MSKSSLDYAELAGLELALGSLKLLPQPTNEQCIVIEWIEQRIKFLQEK